MFHWAEKGLNISQKSCTVDTFVIRWKRRIVLSFWHVIYSLQCCYESQWPWNFATLYYDSSGSDFLTWDLRWYFERILKFLCRRKTPHFCERDNFSGWSNAGVVAALLLRHTKIPFETRKREYSSSLFHSSHGNSINLMDRRYFQSPLSQYCASQN